MTRILLQPKGLEFDADAGETISDAAARHGIRLPISCRNGVCELCEGYLTKGSVSAGASRQTIEAAGNTTILLCRCWALEDCEIEIANVYGPGELPLKNVVCQIEGVEPILAHVYRVALRLPAGKAPEFFAGQYLALHLPDKEGPCFYSIASAPGSTILELHIQADPHLASANEVITYLQNNNTVKASLPHGRACLAKVPDHDVILLAAGTGFAQMKSIIEYLLASEFEHQIHLYWGVRQPQDMYLKEFTEAWSARTGHFHFTSLIADIDNVQGLEHHEQMAEAVLAHGHDLARSLVFVAGSPRLVFSALDLLEQAGLPESHFFSDVMEYAERP
ncbi:MAG: 2Fe-2S iron-sulfur cluster-binding protein [Oleiphilaceae bacterium]|nr:2Fe-2S iron-sulfur cluster-binding protein [Oleiphilaceae bacterium]